MALGDLQERAKVRSWWFHRQGLDGSYQKASTRDVLQRSGWARSVGGVGPYLTLFSRANISRAEADRAAAALEICELPSARGCTYVVPASDYALALKVGETFAEAPLRVAATIGVTAKEVEKLCDAVLRALSKGAMAPDEIREATGDAARPLGEAGKKKGTATTLPLALGELQARGEIRRVPVEGRLDRQRYEYVLWHPNPLASFTLSLEDAYTECARRFFRWIGPATVAEFRWFSGLGVKAARTAVQPLRLAAINPDSDRLLLEEDMDAFQSFQPPRASQYALVSSLDAIHAHRRDVQMLLDRPDADRKLRVETSMESMGGLSDLPSHAILDRGRLIGFWEYDTDARTVVWMTFGIRDKKLTEAVGRTEEYVREQLGDARSFSLDSPASRAPRIAALRAGGE